MKKKKTHVYMANLSVELVAPYKDKRAGITISTYSIHYYSRKYGRYQSVVEAKNSVEATALARHIVRQWLRERVDTVREGQEQHTGTFD